MATTKKISVEIEADTKDAERGIDRVSEALSDAGREASKTSAKFAKVSSSGTRLGASLKEAASGALTMQNALKAMAGLAAAGMAKDLASGILGVGASCIQAAAQMRQYEIAFQTMLKSTSQGTEMLRSLQKFAADTPFDVPGVVSAGQQLMAFGFQAEQIIPMLTSLGDAAAGLGQGSEGVSRLAYALGQMQTSGKLNSQDMMQLTSAGVAAWDMLAQAAGVSITEIKDMTSRGMVDSKEAVKIIVAGLNEEFGGMMEKTSTEVSGLMANIEETVGTTAAVVGQYMIDAFNIKGILQDASDALGEFQSKMQAASDTGKSFTDVIKECVPPGVTLAVGALAAVIGTVLVAGIVAATAALGTFIGLTAPIVAGAAAIGAALAGIVVYWDEIVDAFKIGTNAVLDAITLLGTSLVRGVTGMASAITGLLGDAWGAVTGYQNNWLSDLSSVLAEATNAVAGFARRAVNYFNEVFAAKTKAFSAATPNADAEAAQLAEDFGMWQEGKSSMASPASAAAPASLIKGAEASGSGSVGRSSAGGSVKNEALEAMQRENRIQEARLKAQNDNIKKQMQNEEKLRRAQVSLARKYGTDAQKLSLDLADVEYDKKQQLAEENLSYTEQLLAAENAVKEAMLKGAAQDEIDMLEEKKALLTDNHNLALATINAQATASTQALNGDYLQTLANQRMQGTTAQMTTANEQNRTDAIGDLANQNLPEAEKLTLLDEINEKYEAQKGKIETINKLQELGNSLAKDFASGITDWITGAKDFGSAMKEVLSSLISQLIQAALYALIVASVTGGGGGFAARWKSAFGKGFAGGGSVDGAGTGTSDSIPAMLSNGEYVLNAKATKALGVPFLNGLNTGRISGFAAGGLVGGSAYHEAGGRSTAAAVSGGGSRSVSLSVNALDASGFAEFLGKGGLSAIKQALVDDDRNFNAALGTF